MFPLHGNLVLRIPNHALYQLSYTWILTADFDLSADGMYIIVVIDMNGWAIYKLFLSVFIVLYHDKKSSICCFTIALL